jgi:hypothetical protein
MENEIKTQLEQLEQQRIELLNKQKEIEKESKYYLLVEKRDNYIEREKKKIERQNSLTTQLFDILKEDSIVKNVIKLEESHVLIVYPSYYNEELKEEDRIEPIKFKSLSINTDFGKITDIEIQGGKLKARAPYQISDRYQHLLPSTIIKKIKEKIESNQSKNLAKQMLDKAKNELIEEFQTKYPTAIIAHRSEYVYPPYGRGNRYDIETLTITFQNKSQVKIRYFGDKSFSIMEKKDHRTDGLKKMELIDYLAS